MKNNMLDAQEFFLSYIDPGAGSLILQMVIASCIGAVAVFRRAIFGVFGKKRINGGGDGASKTSQGEKRDDKTK